MADAARKLTPDQHREMLRGMLRGRIVDARLLNMQRQGRIGFYGMATGEEAAVISVLDRGPGISAEDRERIFCPFEQGGDPLTDKPSGIGIGLHEARVIVRQHGGLLEYHARKGGGSECIPLLATTIDRGRGR